MNEKQYEILCGYPTTREKKTWNRINKIIKKWGDLNGVIHHDIYAPDSPSSTYYACAMALSSLLTGNAIIREFKDGSIQPHSDLIKYAKERGIPISLLTKKWTVPQISKILKKIADKNFKQHGNCNKLSLFTVFWEFNYKNQSARSYIDLLYSILDKKEEIKLTGDSKFLLQAGVLYPEKPQKHIVSGKIEKSKTKPRKEKMQLDFVEKEFETVFNDWLEYKKDRRQSYKNATSVKLCYKKLKELSNNNPKIAKEIVEESMANNWAGLFPLDERRSIGTGKSNYKILSPDDEQENPKLIKPEQSTGKRYSGRAGILANRFIDCLAAQDRPKKDEDKREWENKMVGFLEISKMPEAIMLKIINWYAENLQTENYPFSPYDDIEDFLSTIEMVWAAKSISILHTRLESLESTTITHEKFESLKSKIVQYLNGQAIKTKSVIESELQKGFETKTKQFEEKINARLEKMEKEQKATLQTIEEQTSRISNLISDEQFKLFIAHHILNDASKLVNKK